MDTESELHLHMLLQSIQLLAATYEQQIAALPPFVHVPDEVALTFSDTLLFVDDLREESLITTDQRTELERLDTFLEQMSQNKELWTLDNLQTAPEWQQVRLLAESLLHSFQLSKQSPNLFWLQYIPDRKELAADTQKEEN